MNKGLAVLGFLKAAATIRRKRVSAYGPGDRIVWFGGIPRDRAECRSPFLGDNSGQFAELWLEIRKKRMPIRPPVPAPVSEWVLPDQLEQPDKEPELRSEITVLVKQEVTYPSDTPEARETVVETHPEVRCLSDNPDIEEAWLDYLVNQWEPWAKEMQRWQEMQRVYEEVDFMRRRIEEAEERYELLLAVGLLQWRDPTETTVRRHLLTAPAEIRLDAGRGILTVVPGVSFDRFRVELDMLELQHQPHLDSGLLNGQLEELDIQVWDTARLAQILREIANRLQADAQVDETACEPAERAEERPRLSHAPALVLRERRPTAYDELVGKFIALAPGTNSPHEDTTPWRRLLLEGQTQCDDRYDPRLLGASNGTGPSAVGRYLFPLPANDEQRQIIHRLQVDPCVLVKGPPGTGKTHTIANLICHLLASGDRLLVTAHAPKALAVLRGLLPDDIRELCITTLGASRDDQRVLEESVRGILRRQNEWRGPEWTQQRIDHTEMRLQQLEGAIAAVERRLRECREAETHSHMLPGGYQGTAAQIARKLQDDREQFSWFPEAGCAGTDFVLLPADTAFFAEFHGQVAEEASDELQPGLEDLQLPSPERFAQLVAELATAETFAETSRNRTTTEKLECLRFIPPDVLERLLEIDNIAVRAGRVLGAVTETILSDLLVGNVDRWARIASDAEALLRTADTLRGRLGSTLVQVHARVHRDRLRADAERRRAYFSNGGGRGFLFSPKVVKETQYVEERCLVNGEKPKTCACLGRIVDFLQLEETTLAFERMWPIPLPELPHLRLAASRAADMTNELRRVIAFFEAMDPRVITCIPAGERDQMGASKERMAWVLAAKAELAGRAAQLAKDSYQQIVEGITQYRINGSSLPCLQALAQAAETRDINAWRIALAELERLQAKRRRLTRYNEIKARLIASCPGLETILGETAGNPESKSKLLELEKAWAWSNARAWLRRVSDPNLQKELVQEYHRLQRKAEKATEELASMRAWGAFFDHLDGATLQNLNAWTKAMGRGGKWTGKHAYRDRRAAKLYWTRCIPKIPAWVIPLHKLWETVDAQPGMFDTVIIDEASQAGIDSLVLLLLAKRIIVVGDDMQNSPEAVGVLGDDIARLAREHLHEFHFRDEFHPASSLFDHAARAFGNLISLREHFRCVPEIIRFSNDLCYRDAPLIPLRQAPPNRLPPIMSRFVKEGACEGEGSRIRNRAEAESLVETIQTLLADEAYEGKSMGVIALQGHAQAELIETLLAQRLDPKTMGERRLRCGEAATFQGDQRDVMFLSLVIAPNVRYRALGSRLPDQRRFNVAMSRARDQVWLFHSVRQHDLSAEDLRRTLLSFFENPAHGALSKLSEEMEHLEREARRTRRIGNQPEPYESWFELDVALELLRRKYAVRPQVEIAGRRIDLMVEGVDARLAVECYGDEWHGAEQYEHDMTRQRQLERAGLTFAVVRESDFYADRHGAMKAVTDACESLDIYPLDHDPDPPMQGLQTDNVVGEDNADSVAESPQDGDEKATEEDLSSIPDGPFSGYSDASGFPDPRETSPANVRAAVAKIIQTDGPLTKFSVYRLYVEGCPGLHRVGKGARQALTQVLGAMLGTGEIVQEDELRDGSPEGQVIRLADQASVRIRPAGRRDFLEIPPSELLAVLKHLFPMGITQDEEAMCRKVLEHYGFTRLTRPRRDYLSKVLRLRE